MSRRFPLATIDTVGARSIFPTSPSPSLHRGFIPIHDLMVFNQQHVVKCLSRPSPSTNIACIYTSRSSLVINTSHGRISQILSNARCVWFSLRNTSIAVLLSSARWSVRSSHLAVTSSSSAAPVLIKLLRCFSSSWHVRVNLCACATIIFAVYIATTTAVVMLTAAVMVSTIVTHTAINTVAKTGMGFIFIICTMYCTTVFEVSGCSGCRSCVFSICSGISSAIGSERPIMHSTAWRQIPTPCLSRVTSMSLVQSDHSAADQLFPDISSIRLVQLVWCLLC